MCEYINNEIKLPLIDSHIRFWVTWSLNVTSPIYIPPTVTELVNSIKYMLLSLVGDVVMYIVSRDTQFDCIVTVLLPIGVVDVNVGNTILLWILIVRPDIGMNHGIQRNMLSSTSCNIKRLENLNPIACEEVVAYCTVYSWEAQVTLWLTSIVGTIPSRIDPLTAFNSPLQSQNLSLLALVILQTERHPALESDPLLEDTPFRVNAIGRTMAPTF